MSNDFPVAPAFQPVLRTIANCGGTALRHCSTGRPIGRGESCIRLMQLRPVGHHKKSPWRVWPGAVVAINLPWGSTCSSSGFRINLPRPFPP